MITSEAIIIDIVKQQRSFFLSGKTMEYEFRINALKNLEKAIRQYEQKLYEALWEDLHKSEHEAFLTEVSMVLSEIRYHKKNLKSWMRPKRVATPLHLFPSSSHILHEPYGCTLIISPWNYPFQLMINPLVGAISAGNCAILRPSPLTPNVSSVIKEMIETHFDKTYIAVIEGSFEENQILMKQKFDFIFFTGSPGFGKEIMKAASEFLTPVILELGGKSPCIIDEDARIDNAAKRVIWGKLLNAGQTCIAPDYVFVHKKIKTTFIEHLKKYIHEFYGENIHMSRDYPRIVSEEAVQRLISYLDGQKIVTGGEYNIKEKYIAPTIVDEVKREDKIMQTEIFGPLLPLLDFENIEDVYRSVNQGNKPLALYYFGYKNEKNVLKNTTSGGVCINDTILHVANHHLPFGGVNNSGIGKYHGRFSFTGFSNQRSLLKSKTWFDIPFKYAPYKNLNILKKILG